MVEQNTDPVQPTDEQRMNIQGYSDPWTRDVSFWRELLEGDDVRFEGDIDRGAALLYEVAQGMGYVAQKEGMTVSPALGVLPYGIEGTQAFYRDPENPNLILIRASFLQSLTAFDPQAMYHFRRDDGEILFSGYVNDFAFIEGVEDTHHIFRDPTGENTQAGDPRVLSAAQYDAQDHELAALEYMLEVAGEKEYPQISKDSLRRRINNALFEQAKGLTSS